MPETYFTRRRKALLKRFKKLGVIAKESLSNKWGEDFAETILAEAEPQFEALIPHLPDAGSRAPHLRSFMVIAAVQLALYKAMSAHRKTARETWLVCRHVTERELFGLPRIARWLGKVLFFSWFARRRMRKLAKLSQSVPVGGNVFEYIEGDGETFDFGVTYSKCATHQLMLDHDGAELAPFLCLGDIPCSEALGWGIQRTTTLAQGCKQCDFRFKKGGQTMISPPDWLPEQ